MPHSAEFAWRTVSSSPYVSSDFLSIIGSHRETPPQERYAQEHSTRDIKKDLTENQLAAFGAAALAYNILEDQIDALLHVVTNVPDWLITEVSSRWEGGNHKQSHLQDTSRIERRKNGE